MSGVASLIERVRLSTDTRVSLAVKRPAPVDSGDRTPSSGTGGADHGACYEGSWPGRTPSGTANCSRVAFVLWVAALWIAMGTLWSATAKAAPPMPSRTTETIYGAQRLRPGNQVIGATTGFPESSFDFYTGLREKFDLGVHLGITYGGHLSGKRQRVGMDAHVPLRWNMLQSRKVAGALRVAPYFMLGECCPSFSFGADVAFLVDIPLPKIFKLYFGPEIRTGFATVGDDPRRRSGYDGGFWGIFGMETLLNREWFIGSNFQGGGLWGSGDLGGDGLIRALFYFGYALD